MLDNKKIEKLSESVHIFDANGNVYLFANYANRLYKLTNDEKSCLEYAFVRDFKSIENLHKKGFDCEAFLTNLYNICIVNSTVNEESNLESLILLVSEACNFACTYCYGTYGEKSTKMNLETAIKAVDLALELGIRDIVFFGGEPLTNFHLIKNVVEYIEREKMISVTFRMTTNASLVTEEHGKYFKEHNFEISVSMDGDRDSHNLTRMYKGMNTSYDDVVRGVLILKKYNVLSLIEVTYSARHKNLYNQLRAAFDLYPVVSCACVDGKFGSRHEKDIIRGTRLKQFYREILDFEEKELRQGEELFGARELYNRICDGNRFIPPKYLCSDIGSRLIVSPDGNIAPCPEMTHINKFVITNVNEIDSTSEFIKRRNLTLESLLSDKIEKKWFSGLCETCIQHVVEKGDKYIYEDETSFGECIEDLLVRFINKNNEE